MSDIILLRGCILIDTDDIQELQGLEYMPSTESERKGKPEDELAGKFVVRVFSKTPFIDLVCDSLPEAQQLYKNILKSHHVVDINEMRYGK